MYGRIITAEQSRALEQLPQAPACNEPQQRIEHAQSGVRRNG
jgi:hypothetical protein